MHPVLKVIVIIIVVILGSCVATFGYCVYKSNNPDVGLGASSLSGFPSGGRDYYYCISPMNKNVYFEIDEPLLIEWINENQFIHKGHEDINGVYQNDMSKSMHLYIDGKHTFNSEFTEGIWIMNRGMNGGGYTVAYDRKTKRCFYNWSSH